FIIAPLLSPFTVPRAPTSTLFPYTTLFRSHHEVDRRLAVAGRHERKGALAAQRRAESGVLRRRRSPGHQRPEVHEMPPVQRDLLDRKSTRLNSSHRTISYAVFCLKKKSGQP